jgi:glycosyltransferase involved in cell wall biosynthesis
VQVLCAGEWQRGGDYFNGWEDSVYEGVAVRRVHLNWTQARDPNRALYDADELREPLRDWLIAWRPDVVHATSCYTVTAAALESARELGIPVVVSLSDYWFLCPRVTLERSDGVLCDGRTSPWECLRCTLRGQRALEWTRRVLPEGATAALLGWASRRPSLSRLRGLRGYALDMADRKAVLKAALASAARVVAFDGFLRQLFESAGVAAAYREMRAGIEPPTRVARNEPPPGSPLRFGYLGQVKPLKGVEVLTRAFAGAEWAAAARLTVYGGPVEGNPYRDRLIAEAEASRAPITFAGAVERGEIGRALAGLDVLVVPSLWYEVDPRVAQEAAAAGLPVIASDVGGIRGHLRHESGGLLFERGSVEALRSQMERLVREPGLLARLRASVPPFRPLAATVEELEALYAEVVAEAAASSAATPPGGGP